MAVSRARKRASWIDPDARDTQQEMAPRVENGAPQLYSLAEAAAITKRNPELLRRWCASGRLACRRIGASWIIQRRELERIDGMPKRGMRRPPRSDAIADLGVLRPGLRAEVESCLEPGETVRVVVVGAEDAALVATERRVFLARDGVLVHDARLGVAATWPLRSLRRVQLEVGAATGALILTPQDPDDRALVVVLARPHLARAQAATDVLRELLDAAGSYR